MTAVRTDVTIREARRDDAHAFYRNLGFEETSKRFTKHLHARTA